MFKKKKCPSCGRRLDEKYDFCPYCGNKLDSDEDSGWGMLGKSDFTPIANEIKLPVGFNALFNSIMKNLSKEFDEQLNKSYFHSDEKQPKKIKREGVSISISTFGNGPPKIKVTQMGTPQRVEQEKPVEKITQKAFAKENIKKFAGLKREEPKTSIRRLSDKVVYELEMPGVRSVDDVSIMKLESSIEVKAIAGNKAYVKIIPINLPIKNYALSEGKLILELGIKN
jgi:RNA polymerase subunit RPABC4/transcription elongation factor Spt4